MEIRFSELSDDFGKIAERVAEYYGYDKDMVFLSDKAKKGSIYSRGMRVRDELYPLLTVMPLGYKPTLFVKLTNNMKPLKFIAGGNEDLEQQK